jgi:hypothetical protein
MSNKKIKNKYFGIWLSKKIGSKDKFVKRFDWKKRELSRWTHGQNFPKLPVQSALLYDIHLYTGQEYTSLLIECNEALMKDYKEFKYGTT